MELNTKKNLYELLLNEPYRVFFPLGCLAALAGSGYWVSAALGLNIDYNPAFHAYIQIELFAAAFAVGFLLTAIPKFTRTTGADNLEFWAIIITYIFTAILLLSNNSTAGNLAFAALLIMLFKFCFLRFRLRKASLPGSFALVGFGLLSAFAGSLLVGFPGLSLAGTGRKLLFEGVFLCLSLGIGSFLGPRLMGIVENASSIVQLPRSSSGLTSNPDPAMKLSTTIGVLLILSFFLDTGVSETAGTLARAVLASICLYKFRVFSLPTTHSAVGYFIAISLWLMVAGLWLSAIFAGHRIAMMHITYIGGFGMLILAISAQVTSSHGGHPEFWKENRIAAIICCLLVVLSAIVRVTAAYFPQPEFYFILLGLSATLFILALTLWMLGLLRYLTGTPQAAVLG